MVMARNCSNWAVLRAAAISHQRDDLMLWRGIADYIKANQIG
jgi:hypothetical protein